MEKKPEKETTKAVPLDLEGLSPEAAVALKRHNPRITESTEMLAETIRRVRSGVKPLDEDIETVLREGLLESHRER